MDKDKMKDLIKNLDWSRIPEDIRNRAMQIFDDGFSMYASASDEDKNVIRERGYQIIEAISKMSGKKEDSSIDVWASSVDTICSDISNLQELENSNLELVAGEELEEEVELELEEPQEDTEDTMSEELEGEETVEDIPVELEVEEELPGEELLEEPQVEELPEESLGEPVLQEEIPEETTEELVENDEESKDLTDEIDALLESMDEAPSREEETTEEPEDLEMVEPEVEEEPSEEGETLELEEDVPEDIHVESSIELDETYYAEVDKHLDDLMK